MSAPQYSQGYQVPDQYRNNSQYVVNDWQERFAVKNAAWSALVWLRSKTSSQFREVSAEWISAWSPLLTSIGKKRIMRKVANGMKFLTQRNLKMVVIALGCAVMPVSGAMAQSHGGSGGHGGAGGIHGGIGGFRGGYGGFYGYGRPGFGFYFGGPYLGWPYYYGIPYGYPYPYDYYYPNADDGYPYPPQAPPGPAAAAPEGLWYYCDNPKGYYPYVVSCSGQWREVSPTPVPPRPPASQPSADH